MVHHKGQKMETRSKGTQVKNPPIADNEAEQIVLASLLISPQMIPKINVDPKHFSFINNRKIYESLLNLHRQGTYIDLKSLAEDS
jgi:replicative DNA helicase